MPIDAIDAQLQSLISGARVESAPRQKVDSDLEEAEETRKRAEQKLLQLKQQQQLKVEKSETFNKQRQVQEQFNQFLTGSAGFDIQQGAQAWNNNAQIQAKLTAAQKMAFQEAMAQNPRSTAQAGVAMDRLSQQPGFSQAVTGAPVMGVVQQQLLAKPQLEAAAAQLLQSPFVQSNKGDAQTKARFLEFGLRQTTQGKPASVATADRMMASLVGAKVPALGQRAALGMAQRRPDNLAGMDNIDSLVRNEGVRSLPSLSRAVAVSVLAKANGAEPVKDGLVHLANNEGLRDKSVATQSAALKTLGLVQQKQAPGFAQKIGQFFTLPGAELGEKATNKLLNKMVAQANKAGTDAVDPRALRRELRSQATAQPPTLAPTEGQGSTESSQARMANVANVQRYRQQIENGINEALVSVKSARYLEKLTELRLPKRPAAVMTREVKAELTQQLSALASEQRGQGGLKRALSGSVGQWGDSGQTSGDKPTPSETAPEQNKPQAPLSGRAGLRARMAAAEKARAKAQGLETKTTAPLPPFIQQLADSLGLQPGEIDAAALRARLGARAQAILDAGEVIDTSGLTAEDEAQTLEQLARTDKEYTEFEKLLNQKKREYRYIREPPSKRRARLENERLQGRQEKYVTVASSGGGAGAAQIFAAAPDGSAAGQRLAPTPQRAQQALRHSSTPGGAGRTSADVSAAVNQGIAAAGGNNLTAEQIATIQTLAKSAVQEFAASVTQQMVAALTQNGGTLPAVAAGPSTPTSEKPRLTQPRGTAGASPRGAAQGGVDGWGIPRNFERDLGGVQATMGMPLAGQAPAASASSRRDAAAEPTSERPYAGRALTRGPVRPLAQFIGDTSATWKSLGPKETALLQNLGWTGLLWDARHNPNTKWPAAMFTLFAQLTADQQRTVRSFELSEDEWNQKVLALKMGKNA